MVENELRLLDKLLSRVSSEGRLANNVKHNPSESCRAHHFLNESADALNTIVYSARRASTGSTRVARRAGQ